MYFELKIHLELSDFKNLEIEIEKTLIYSFFNKNLKLIKSFFYSYMF